MIERDERDEHIMQASCLAEQAGQCQGVPLLSLILLSVRVLKPATSSLIISPRGEHGASSISILECLVHAKAN